MVLLSSCFELLGRETFLPKVEHIQERHKLLPWGQVCFLFQCGQVRGGVGLTLYTGAEQGEAG